MPGYPTHWLIQHRIAEAGKSLTGPPSDACRKMLDNPDAAALGSVGPDLTFFLDLMPVAQVWLQRGIKAYDTLAGFVRPYTEAIHDVEAAVDSWASGAVPGYTPVRDAFREFGATFDALQGTLLTALAAFATGYIDGFAYIKLPMQRGGREEDWFWFDMLHYRRTGRFARNLFVAAGSNARLQAFAAGYSTHLAADTAGHSFVNCCAGAPYRTQWQRHHCSDNYIDVWTMGHYHGLDVNESRWHTRYPTEMEPGIRRQFLTALKATYADIRHPDGRRLDGREWPDDDDLSRMWEMLALAMKKQTAGYSVPRPKPPGPPIDLDAFPDPPSFTETSEGERRRSGFSWKSLSDALWDFISGTAEYVAGVVKWVGDSIAGLALYPVRYALYLIQLACYEVYRACRRVLALRGYVYAHPDELTGGAEVSSGLAGSIAGAVLVGADRLQYDAEATYYRPSHRLEPDFPHQEGLDAAAELLADAKGLVGEVSDEVRIALEACLALGGFPLSFQRPWLYPASPLESGNTLNAPYEDGCLPDAFIENAPFSAGYYEAVKKVKTVSEMLALSAAAAGVVRANVQGGRGAASLGNATDLGVAMLRDLVEDTGAPDFNLDGDRGYAWLCWDVAPLGSDTRKTGDFAPRDLVIGDDVGKMKASPSRPGLDTPFGRIELPDLGGLFK